MEASGRQDVAERRHDVLERETHGPPFLLAPGILQPDDVNNEQ